MKTQKTWFITGASRGFGLDITAAVLASGDKVIATVRSQPEQLAASFNNHPDLYVVTLDVTNEAQAKTAAEQAISHFGRIDVLVNNAGYGILAGVEEATAEEVRQNYEVNVFGILNTIRAVLPYMRRQGTGHVINISSIGGLAGYAGWGVYGSTKFAIEGLTEALAQELAPLGIYATVVAPGFFRTNFLDKSSLIRTANEITDYAATVGAVREFATQANRQQPGDPKKLAQAFIRLAAAEKPPVHLPLGTDTYQKFYEKAKAYEQEMEAWKAVVTSTDHEDVKATA
ncbi:SDR family NAD(P)-dependent oxidoreductase [Chitinophaga agrisoli]|uniref:SDR family NAD(P)-dependent oxidoreductase n=1 Tax=Chitinophaga agrisoli TaxID=2607653 RepID=A0A5B2VYC6_9BACT|nr:oxidoreductase [Chitinophaga agrisoli]KAA2243332.1 SDR family NAD(P)-dependent oxidoreductase [Chitinophaga agrisoli]